MYFADLLCTLLVNSDSSNLFNSASLQDESDDSFLGLCFTELAVLIWVLFIVVGLFVVGNIWSWNFSPSDKPDGSHEYWSPLLLMLLSVL